MLAVAGRLAVKLEGANLGVINKLDQSRVNGCGHADATCHTHVITTAAPTGVSFPGEATNAKGFQQLL